MSAPNAAQVDIPTVQVKIVNFDEMPVPAKAIAQVGITANNYKLTGAAGEAIQICGQTPNRIHTVLNVLGLITDIVYLATSKSDAERLNGFAIVGATAPTELFTTDALWAFSPTTPYLSVAQEYRIS